jgi:chromosomal replication initiator protein
MAANSRPARSNAAGWRSPQAAPDYRRAPTVEADAARRRAYLFTLPELEPPRAAYPQSTNLPVKATHGDNTMSQAPVTAAPDELADELAELAESEGIAPQAGQGREASPEFDPHAVWQMVLSELALHMPPATYDTWVRDTVVMGYEDGEFIIGMPNAYARDWLENRLRHTIKRTLGSIMRRSVQIQFRVRTRSQAETLREASHPASKRGSVTGTAPLYAATTSGLSQEAPVTGSPQSYLPPSTAEPGPAGHIEPPRTGTQLNPQHTFETFVVGNHNRLAHAAALAIVDAPGQTFNPLFVYGGVGLGKTHLLNAIGNSMTRRGYSMIYCSSEQFTNELIAAIRAQNTEQFRNKYRQVDVLLIDDIQFIGGRESTQEEFFHTFNHLQAAGKQVVLSSDRPPKALATLEERLRSRFEGGLQTDIAQPDFETRVAILQSKANRMGVSVPYDVLMLVAERIDSNIRELEGALNRLIMQARLTSTALNFALAKSLMENLAPQRLPCAPAAVIRLVAEHFHLRADELTGRKRTKEIANARQIAMYLLREENELSLPAIGEHLGGRDHSTVRYGVERVAEDLDRDEALRMTILALREKVYAPVA